MHARTTLALTSLALAVLSYAGASAQTPAATPVADSPDVETNKPTPNDTRNRTPEQTDKEGQTKKKKKKKKPATSRGPTLTQLQEVVVEADRPLSAASSQVIRARDFALRPHSTTQEILNNVPGLLVVQLRAAGRRCSTSSAASTRTTAPTSPCSPTASRSTW